MASSGKRGKTPTVEDLTAKLTALEMENRQLRKRIKETKDSGSTSEVLTPAQREALIMAAVSKLTATAGKKITQRVKDATARCVTREDMEGVLSTLRMRIDVSMTEGAEESPKERRGRSVSRAGRKT